MCAPRVFADHGPVSAGLYFFTCFICFPQQISECGMPSGQGQAFS